MGNTNEVTKRVYLYGLASDGRIVRYSYVKDFSVDGVKAQAELLRAQYPAIEKLYMADNSYDMYTAAQDSIHKGLMEDISVFKIMLETKGMLVVA